MRVKNYSLIALAICALGLFVTSCHKNGQGEGTSGKLVADYDYKVVKSWNDLFLIVERYAAGYRPGPAPRALAYMGFSAYEACITGMPEYNSLANLYPGLSIPAVENGKDYHWPTV